MAMTTQEKTTYKARFNKESYDRVGLYLPKGKDGQPGMKEIWQREADRDGVPLAEFVKGCVNEKINNLQK